MNNNTDPKIQEIKERLEQVDGDELEVDVFDVITRKEDGKIIAEVFNSDHAALFGNAQTDISYLLSVIERLQTENKVMEVVLKWYADKDNCDPVHLDKYGYIPIDKDEGERARIALSHLKG